MFCCFFFFLLTVIRRGSFAIMALENSGQEVSEEQTSSGFVREV